MTARSPNGRPEQPGRAGPGLRDASSWRDEPSSGRRPFRRPDALRSFATSRLARRLARHVEGAVRFDAISCALYSTDASIYEVPPLGVVLPKTLDDVEAVLDVAREEGVPVLPRGAGTSQCGQTVGRAVVVDTSRHLTRICAVDEEDRTATVEPGVVLDALNRALAPSGLFFPVDVATASRATIGGMAGNNSGGARSIRYGVTADNVLAIEASLPEGGVATFGPGGGAGRGGPGRTRGPAAKGSRVGADRAGEIVARVQQIAEREASELERRVPGVARHVAGYNLHRLLAPGAPVAELLVGSEGTLAFFRRITLKLARRPRRRVLATCGFPSLRSALDAVQHIVELRPHAVELVDEAVLRLARRHDQFRGAVEGLAPGGARAVLLVEFAGEEREPLLRKLDALEDATGPGGHGRGISRAETAAAQDAVWRVRRTAMNIVMSAEGPRRPVSIVEDCAVPLPLLAEYAEAVTDIFARHGTRGAWYAHASVGCLHVRPSLDVRDPGDLAALRAIAEETHDVVRRLGGSHSGEHGDGILRSEFIEPMLGSRLAGAFADVKRAFDPDGLMNPGKIVDPPRMDDAALLRLEPARAPTDDRGRRDMRREQHGLRGAPADAQPVTSRAGEAASLPSAPGGAPLPLARHGGGGVGGMDWTDTGGFAAALGRCNNNGACRKTQSGVMCPSFRVTREERDATRGRANVLRLAMSGALGPEGLGAPEVADALELCVACKACRRECPVGVDMARMKAETLYRRRQTGRRAGGARAEIRQRLFASLPRYAPAAARARRLLNLRNRSPRLAWAGERLLGISAGRALPAWQARPFRDAELAQAAGNTPLVPEGSAAVLFVDTFHRFFEPEVARAGATVLRNLGVEPLAAVPDGPPLCCGRTWISAGLLDQARATLARTVGVLAPLAATGLPILGLEPSCLLTLREDAPLLVPGEEARVVADRAVLLDERLAASDFSAERRQPVEVVSGRGSGGVARVHGHCHQKAAGAAGATLRVVEMFAGLQAVAAPATCCGMAGSFGYEAEHASISQAMGELDLLPAVRASPTRDVIVANGFSCRSQIREFTDRTPRHVATLIAERMAGGGPAAP